MLWLYIVLGLVGGGIFMYFLLTFIISCIIYTKLFVRTSPKKWGRHVSWPDAELADMFKQGEKWGQLHEDKRKRVEIDSCGFHLVGEYFDFGYDRAVIIIPGRSESGTYSYYFSEPYRLSGFNVLAIDNRGHGLSEGKYNSLGLKEYKDILKWGKFLHDELHIKQIYMHGICIGSATAIHLLARKDCPDYFIGLTAEGTYTTFYDIFNNQMRARKKPIFPHTYEVLGIVSLRAGKSLRRNSPIHEADKIKVPVLFLYSKKDSYAKPEKSLQLYSKIKSEKRLEWFDEGEHSHIRIHNSEKYDQTIIKFLKDYFPNER